MTGEELPKRKYVVSEWHTEWGYTVSPGRMLRTDRYKYTKYVEDGAEELYDLQKDPFEKKNAAKDPSYADVLEEMRQLLSEHEVLTESTPLKGCRGRLISVGEAIRQAIRITMELQRRWRRNRQKESRI